MRLNQRPNFHKQTGSKEAQEKIGDAPGDLGTPRHCEVRLVKLDKVHLLKATQRPWPGGDGGLISCDVEVFVILRYTSFASSAYMITCINTGNER